MTEDEDSKAPETAAAELDGPRFTLSQAQQEAHVIVEIARVLDGHGREAQLRILEAACVMLGDDGYAEAFRSLRLAGELPEVVANAGVRRRGGR